MKFITSNLSVLFLAVCLISLSSCSSSDVSEKQKSISLKQGKWILKSLYDRKIITPETGSDIFMEFSNSGNRIKGFGGCNNFSGNYEVKGNSMKFRDIAATEMFCEFRMDDEKEFFSVLGETEIFKIEKTKLYFLKDDKVIAAFESVKIK